MKIALWIYIAVFVGSWITALMLLGK